MQPEILIHTNKLALKKNCFIMLIGDAFLLFSLFFVRNSLSTSYLSSFIQGLLILLIAIISTTLIYSFYRINRTLPMAIINQKGIWIKQFGIIPWNNILEVDTFLVPNSISIHVRDTALLSKQATIAGKMILLESKVFKSPTIVIDNMELDNQTVVDFAKQFIEEAI